MHLLLYLFVQIGIDDCMVVAVNFQLVGREYLN